MKKLISAILLLTMVFALVACGGNKYNNTENNNPYNLDMKSTEKQKMSADRASKDVLRETAQTYLAGLNYFEGTDQATLTYNDLKEHIGVDASSYRYDEARMCELYVWYADGDDTAVLYIWIMDGKLDACSAINL